jgi:hypothetical protein
VTGGSPGVCVGGAMQSMLGPSLRRAALTQRPTGPHGQARLFRIAFSHDRRDVGPQPSPRRARGCGAAGATARPADRGKARQSPPSDGPHTFFGGAVRFAPRAPIFCHPGRAPGRGARAVGKPPRPGRAPPEWQNEELAHVSAVLATLAEAALRPSPHRGPGPGLPSEHGVPRLPVRGLLRGAAAPASLNAWASASLGLLSVRIGFEPSSEPFSNG